MSVISQSIERIPVVSPEQVVNNLSDLRPGDAYVLDRIALSGVDLVLLCLPTLSLKLEIGLSYHPYLFKYGYFIGDSQHIEDTETVLLFRGESGIDLHTHPIKYGSNDRPSGGDLKIVQGRATLNLLGAFVGDGYPFGGFRFKEYDSRGLLEKYDPPMTWDNLDRFLGLDFNQTASLCNEAVQKCLGLRLG